MIRGPWWVWCLLAAGASPLAGQAGTVALWPLAVDGEVGSAAQAQARFDSLIAARLKDAGFTVVAAAETQRIFDRIRDSIGGFYDTYTGRLIEQKLAAVTGATRRELATRFGASISVRGSIFVWGVPFGGGTARWHGTSESSGGRGGLAGLLIGRSEGQVPALSLGVFARDTAGALLYQRAGGIQLLGKLADGKVYRVPAESLFIDAARNEAAVRMALDSLPAALAARKAP